MHTGTILSYTMTMMHAGTVVLMLCYANYRYLTIHTMVALTVTYKYTFDFTRKYNYELSQWKWEILSISIHFFDYH